MKTETSYFLNGQWNIPEKSVCNREHVQLLLLFGITDTLEHYNHHELLRIYYPNAQIVGCSTGWMIDADNIIEEGAVATAVEFKHASVKVCSKETTNVTLPAVLEELVATLPKKGLKHLFILADGLIHNGDLIASTLKNINGLPSVTGGMASDGMRFDHTAVLANTQAKPGIVAIIAFYGNTLHFSYGTKAGWEEFGAEWTVTKSNGNIVYEFNDKPALDFYQMYLGEYMNDIEQSRLLFPLIVKNDQNSNERLRELMKVNEDGSLLYAGSVPQGSIVRLCKTNADKLIDGAAQAAQEAILPEKSASLCIAVSCMARINVMQQLSEAELEKVSELLGMQTPLCGFYSYGELAPENTASSECLLHNQTMTLTAIYED